MREIPQDLGGRTSIYPFEHLRASLYIHGCICVIAFFRRYDSVHCIDDIAVIFSVFNPLHCCKTPSLQLLRNIVNKHFVPYFSLTQCDSNSKLLNGKFHALCN